MTRVINEEGEDIVRRYEGCRLDPYEDAEGYQTVGFGHRITKQDGIRSSITLQQAEDLLDYDLGVAEDAVTAMTSVTLNDNQFSALVSFVFNLGQSRFRYSTLRALVNRSAFLDAADEFPKWRHAGGRELAGLKARRAEERALFLRPVIVT